MNKFDELVAEITAMQGSTDALAKALPADDGEGDEKIVAAAGAEGGEGQGASEPADEKKDGEGEGDAPMTKSFKVTLADGSEAEAVDATELVKSLQAEVGALTGKLTANETTVAKALEMTLGVVKSQGLLLKAQGERLDKLAGEGRGRKSAVVIHDKPAAGTEAAPAEKPGMKPEEFMAKAMTAYEGGKITGVQVGAIDVCLRTGQPIDPSLIQKIVG